jgi:hypothetical protein
MQEQKFQELETRASETGVTDQIKKLEARARVHQEIEAMKAEGKAFELSTEEESMLKEFRVFRLRMKKDGEVFTWQTRKPDGVQVVSESTPVLTHPAHGS